MVMRTTAWTCGYTLPSTRGVYAAFYILLDRRDACMQNGVELEAQAMINY